MEKIPDKCMGVNAVSSFCDCMADVESADAAARGFCARVKNNDKKIIGDDLAELKKALKDLEEKS